MIRGTNRKIIEINKVDSPYFERAILFLKAQPDGRAVRCETEAQQTVQQLVLDYRRRPGLRFWAAAVRYLGCAAAGGLFALLMLQ